MAVIGKVLRERSLALIRYVYSAVRRWRDYGGRSSRIEFWSFVFVSAVLYGALNLLTPNPYPDALSTLKPLVGPVIELLQFVEASLWLVLGLPFLALVSRRFHDAGLSAWFVVLGFFTAHLSTLVITLLPSRDAGKRWNKSEVNRPVDVSEGVALERHPQMMQHPRLSQRMRRAPIIQSIVWWCLISPLAFVGTTIPLALLGESCKAAKGVTDYSCSLAISSVVFVFLCLITPLLQWFVFICFCTSEASVRAFRVVFALNFLPGVWLLLWLLSLWLLLLN